MEAAGTSIGANKEIKRRKRKMNQGLEDEKPRFPLQTRLGLGVLFPLSKEQLKKDKEVVDVATKIDLMKQSQFYRFINNGSQRPNSLPFSLAIVNRYDRQEKAFVINGEKMTITVDDVAYLLGLESEGNKPQDTKKTVECELHFDSLNHKYCLEGYDTNEKQLERLNILNILKLMKAESEEEKLWFRKLLSFYIISFVVYPTSSTSACFAKFSLVQDLDEFEKVNWAQVILDQLLDFVSGYEGKDNVNKMTYVCCLVILLEAWFYMKIGIEHVNDTRDSDAAPIYKYLGKLYLRMESCNAILDDCSSIKPMSKPREKKEKKPRKHVHKPESHAQDLKEYCEGMFLRKVFENENIDECEFFHGQEELILELKHYFCEDTLPGESK